MTDQDELRDRLTSLVCKKTGCDIYDAEISAQAIIDEFELTTETHAATHAKRTMTRIISAWEWEKQ